MRMVKLFLAAMLLASLFSSLSYAVVPDRIPGALTGGATVTLKGNVHHKALPQFDQGPADPSLRLGYMTLLTVPTPAQQKALKQLLADQQNRKSPNYHKWLTADQWADRFGLSRGDVAEDHFLAEVAGIHREQRGARPQLDYVRWHRGADAKRVWDPRCTATTWMARCMWPMRTEPKIPAALAGIVTGLRGLHDFHLKPHAAKNMRAAMAARGNYYDPIFTTELVGAFEFPRAGRYRDDVRH